MVTGWIQVRASLPMSLTLPLPLPLPLPVPVPVHVSVFVSVPDSVSDSISDSVSDAASSRCFCSSVSSDAVSVSASSSTSSDAVSVSVSRWSNVSASYNGSILLSEGAGHLTCNRQRPKLLVREDGTPTHLYRLTDITSLRSPSQFTVI